MSAFQLEIPVDQYSLDNGLRVVLSPDTSAPVILVGVYYHVGMRLEPRGRTGFAHLFEHLMFCLLYTSPSPRDRTRARMPSSA